MTTPMCARSRAVGDLPPRSGNVRVVDWLVSELRRHAVDFVFGVDGANIEDLYDAVHLRAGHASRSCQTRVLGWDDG